MVLPAFLYETELYINPHNLLKHEIKDCFFNFVFIKLWVKNYYLMYLGVREGVLYEIRCFYYAFQ